MIVPVDVDGKAIGRNTVLKQATLFIGSAIFASSLHVSVARDEGETVNNYCLFSYQRVAATYSFLRAHCQTRAGGRLVSDAGRS